MCEHGSSAILSPPPSLGIRKWDGSPKTLVSVDSCLVRVIQQLWDNGVITLACCCGHGERDPSIVLHNDTTAQEAERVRELIAEVDDRNFELSSWIRDERKKV